MSLIHWWPLNGNLNDYGINNIPLTNQGSVTYSNSGKIGKGASFTSDSQSLKATDLATLSALTQYTMTCWVYLTNTATNHSSAFLSSGDWNSTSAQVCFGLYNYSSGYNKLLVPNKTGGWDKGISLSSSIKLNTWHHYAITYDGTTTKAYIDGVYVGAYNGGGINSNSVGYYYLGAATYYSGFTMKGVLNDFRIYNSVLSVAEIRDVSRALVLHYNFEDPYIEGTTNLANSITAGQYSGWGTITFSTLGTNSYRIKNTATSSSQLSVWSSWGYSVSGYVGQNITFSATIKNLTFSNANISNCWIAIGQANTGEYPNHVLSSGEGNYIKYEGDAAGNLRLTWSGVLQSPGRVLIEVWTNASTAPGYVQFDAIDVQVELKNHATPYVNGSRATTVVADNSGYSYNGTINGNLAILKDTDHGQYSMNFVSNAYVQPVNIPDFNQVTYSLWIKLADNANGYRCVFAPKDYPVNSGIWLSFNTESCGLWAYQGGNSPNYCKVGAMLSTGVWYHCVHVFNNGVAQWYLNGSAVGSPVTYTGRTYIPGGIYTLGDSYTGTTWSGTPFNGQIADFKIYATALSATDVLTEYQRKAAICKNGTLITGNFVEQTTAVELPLTSTYFTLGSGCSFNTVNRLIIVNGNWVGFQFANSLFTLNKCYHLSFDAQYRSGTFLNILGHSNNFAVNAYLDGKKLATAWGSAPSGALAEESVMLDGKWHHFDLYVKYQARNDSYGQWVQVNRTSSSGSALVWFANLMMEEIATITTMPTVQMPTKTEMIQGAGFEEYADHVYVSHTGLIGSSNLVEK